MTTVGVVGQGFVGGSMARVLAERGLRVFTYDKAGKASAGAYEVRDLAALVLHVTRECAGAVPVFFVCLPTPMLPDGVCDTSIVEGAVAELATFPGERVLVVKSTVPPGTTERLNVLCREWGTDAHVVFSPEFLRESTALEDMRHQTRIVVGGPRPWVNHAKAILQDAFPEVPIVKTSSTIAEMVKYLTNVHLAARVVLSCELYQLCEKLRAAGHDIDYDKAVEYARLDPRLGGSHMNVPGDDGIQGARGHCFPKDLAALRALAHQHLGDAPLLLDAIERKNLELVPPEHRDWERMVGRAVSAPPATCVGSDGFCFTCGRPYDERTPGQCIGAPPRYKP